MEKISLCEDFLADVYDTRADGCSHLHVCHYFAHCRDPKCRRPSDFTCGDDSELVCQTQCQNLSPVLLFRLLQFKRQNDERETMEKAFSTPIDLSCPSLVQNRPVDIGHLKNFLRSNGFPVGKILFSMKDEHFHRWRISLRDEQSKGLARNDASPSFPTF